MKLTIKSLFVIICLHGPLLAEDEDVPYCAVKTPLNNIKCQTMCGCPGKPDELTSPELIFEVKVLSSTPKVPAKPIYLIYDSNERRSYIG